MSTVRPPSRTLRQIVGHSEETGITIDVEPRARLPFRLMVIPGAGGVDRVVLDVAHHW